MMRENLQSHSAKGAKDSAVIVGASLSGLMTGIALSQAGMNVTVLERVGAKPRSGAVLQVDSGEIDQTETAKLLRKLASGGIRSAEAWSSIQFRLRREAEADPKIDLRYDTRVQTVNQDNDSAWVVTEKGETFRGDILIGADGHKSTVRRIVAPHKPNAAFAGYMIWISIVDEKDIPGKSRPSLNAPKFSMPDGIGDFLLGTIIAGSDGSTALGERRLGWAWYDNTQNDLLRGLGCVEGSIVRHSLNAADVPEHTLIELADKASVRWDQPWLDAILHSIQSRNFIGTPIAEYVPDILVKGRIAIVGDAAHLPTPLTASGFNASLQDAATLAECVGKGIEGAAAANALLKYESLRLKHARQIVQSGISFSKSFGRR
ncbi:FAD-dependent monooxygenase [Bacillus infantis]|uniref:FAD-dependent monooxygenase n=1 Tax=Bacillus infantis TaxID=324767 RepID=UPI001CD29227|nr:FAD-dependent monooxygenase [Bacillus infantis]MCA1040691.1 FAD-dependent monooxygenase [Bacillus infantis]